MRRIATTLISLASLFVGGTALAQDPYAQDPYAQQQQQQQYEQQPQYEPPPPQPYGQPQYEPQQVEVDPAAPQYGYVGPHPEPYDYGNAPCYAQGAHFHPYPPFDQYLFRQSNGYFYFIGDLGDFGYTGQMWGYQGNHPFPVEYGGGFCYINWPHRHAFAAPASMQFRYVGGYYSYFGPWDAVYYANRASWLGYYNGYYRNSYYGGRYWTARPAPIYRASFGFGAPGVYRHGMVVRSPSGVSITVNPGYGHGYGYGHGHYDRPGVVVGAPPARPGYVAPGRPAYVPPPVARPAYVPPPAGRPTYVAPPPARPATVVAPPPARRAAPPPMAAPPPRRHP